MTSVETERLLLRPFEKDDAESVLMASEDPEIRRWMPWASTQTRQTAIDCGSGLLAPVGPMTRFF